MTFIVSKKEGPHGLLLIITDKDILGKIFEEGKIQLDLTKDFFKGEEKDKEEVKTLIPTARHLHLTGKESVAIGLEMDLVDTKKILWVQKVPHAEVMTGG